jgi:beta-glucosidase/6-phospho-beta-glucosidase/beta-galactosidase
MTQLEARLRAGTGIRSAGCATARPAPYLPRSGRVDWQCADLAFAELQRRHIAPIVDLCHFGVPDWIGNFRNPEFPALFAGYAAAFAQRYPWV